MSVHSSFPLTFNFWEFFSLGNHEDRSIQKNFTFYRECLAKFGDEMGKKVWEEINQVSAIEFKIRG